MVTGSRTDGHVYGEVNSLEDLRSINRNIRSEIGKTADQEGLTELKRRSDYLCTLARSPAWRKKFGAKTDRYLEVAREENRRTVDKVNSTARRHKFDTFYNPWGS